MNQLEIECFLLTASLKSYTKAAEKLFLSQPTISRYVSKLEKELNCKLLARTTQKIELTDAGEQYYHLFLSWKLEMEETQKRIRKMERLDHTMIRLGYHEGWILPEEVRQFLQDFEKRYPMIEIDIRCLGLDESILALEKNDIDMLLIMDHPGIDNIMFSKKEITKINKVIVYSKYHPFAKMDSVTPKDFKDETFYVLDENVDFVIQKNREYCKEYQFVPKIQKVKNIQTIHANVLNGKGVTINDSWGPGCYEGHYKTCPISAKGPVYLVSKTETQTKAFELFLSEFKL